MKTTRIALAIVISALIGLFFFLDLGQYLSLGYLKEQKEALVAYRELNPLSAAALTFSLYVVVTALSVPGATVMTLAIGAIFGLAWGTLLVSFASTIGATLAFLIARFLLRDFVQQRYGEKLAKMNRGVEQDGAFYLFGLRLVPLFPFFVINLAMGLTPIRTWTYYWVSQVGMFAGTLVYVNAGTQLGKLDSLSGILSPQLLLSFVLLGLFPLAAKKGMQWLKSRRDPKTSEETA